MRAIICTALLFFSFLVNAGLEEKFNNLNISFGENLIDFELADAIDMSLHYQYRVKPAYIKNYYSRYDKLIANIDVDPSDKLFSDDSYFFLKMKRGQSIVFIRHFEKQSEALLAPPKTFLLNRIPTTAKKALEYLEPGEFVGFETYLHITVGASYLKEQGWIGLSASTHYMISGNFQLRLFKVTDTKVRVQVLALKTRNKIAKASVKFIDDYKVLGISVIEKQIKKIVPTTLVELGIRKSNEEVFISDYTLDLSLPIVRDAYDSIIQSVKVQGDKGINLSSLSNIQDINLLSRSQKETLEKVVEKNLVQVENLFQQEVRNRTRIEERMVHRNFIAHNFSTTTRKDFKINLKLFHLEDTLIYRKNNISTRDENDERVNYFMPNISMFEDKGYFWKTLNEYKMISVNNLYKTNSNGDLTEFLNIGLFNTYTDKEFDTNEQKNMKERFYKLLPDFITQRIHWGKWSENNHVENARVSHEVYFHKSSFQYFNSLSRAEIETALLHFVKVNKDLISIPKSGSFHKKSLCVSKELKNISMNDPYYGFAKDICVVSQNLKYMFEEKNQAEYNLDNFKRLTKNEFFQDIGFSFLLNLIPEESLEDNLYFYSHWSGKDMPNLVFKFGNAKDGELYESMLNIQSILNHRTFDWRILEDISLKNNN